jgi:hypothetical protein
MPRNPCSKLAASDDISLASGCFSNHSCYARATLAVRHVVAFLETSTAATRLPTIFVRMRRKVSGKAWLYEGGIIYIRPVVKNMWG